MSVFKWDFCLERSKGGVVLDFHGHGHIPPLFSLNVFFPFRVVPFRVVPFRVVPFRVVPFRVVPFRVVPFRVVPFRVVPFRVVPFRNLLPLCEFRIWRTISYITSIKNI